MRSKRMDPHWTENIKSFMNYITDEFLTALEGRLEAKGINHREFAELLGVSEGRVSQIFRNPGNLTLSKMIELSRKLGLKLALLPYDDGDPENVLGPVFSDVFTGIWELLEKPRDYKDLQRVEQYCKNCSKRGVIRAVPHFTSFLANLEQPANEWDPPLPFERVDLLKQAEYSELEQLVHYQNAINIGN